MNVNMIFAIIF